MGWTQPRGPAKAAPPAASRQPGRPSQRRRLGYRQEAALLWPAKSPSPSLNPAFLGKAGCGGRGLGDQAPHSSPYHPRLWPSGRQLKSSLLAGHIPRSGFPPLLVYLCCLLSCSCPAQIFEMAGLLARGTACKYIMNAPNHWARPELYLLPEDGIKKTKSPAVEAPNIGLQRS